MLEQITAAFDRKDYRTVAKLLQHWQTESPKDPWFKLYVGRYQEATGKYQSAEATYRKLLQTIANPKIVAQARQGLQRLEAIEEARRQQAIAQATAEPSDQEPGVLVLQPITGDARQTAIQGFAEVMQLDPYTARLQLPSRGWRLYRTGPIGVMEFYGQALQQAQVPAFWQRLSALQAIHVFQVQHLKYVDPHVTAVCRSAEGQLGSLTFDWSEVSQRVEGILPIFELVVDLNAHKKLERKEKTQDYAHFCDLHLPGRKTILRFCDRTYQFQQSVELPLSPQEPTGLAQVTTRINWNRLLHYLNELQVPVWSDFTPFGESALELIDLFSDQFQSHVHLFRKTKSNWDAAFQLYSSLLFLKQEGEDRTQ